MTLTKTIISHSFTTLWRGNNPIGDVFLFSYQPVMTITIVNNTILLGLTHKMLVSFIDWRSFVFIADSAAPAASLHAIPWISWLCGRRGLTVFITSLEQSCGTGKPNKRRGTQRTDPFWGHSKLAQMLSFAKSHRSCFRVTNKTRCKAIHFEEVCDHSKTAIKRSHKVKKWKRGWLKTELPNYHRRGI